MDWRLRQFFKREIISNREDFVKQFGGIRDKKNPRGTGAFKVF